MKDMDFEQLVTIDKSERGVRITPRLTGLFPDKKFGVVMPPDREGAWPHLNGKPRTHSVEITLGIGDKILVRAFDASAQRVTSFSGKTVIEIPLDKENLQTTRSGIQDALEDFQGFKTAHTSTHLPLQITSRENG